MRSKTQSGILGGLLISGGAYLLFAIISAYALPLQGSYLLRLFSYPGVFFTEAFSFAGLYFPAYLLYNGVQVAASRDNRLKLYSSSMGVFPMLSLAILLRLLIDPGFASVPLGMFLIENFSMTGALIVSSVVSLLTIALILRFSWWYASSGSAVSSAEEELDELEPVSDEGVQGLLAEQTLPEEQRIDGDPVANLMNSELSRFSPREDLQDSVDSQTDSSFETGFESLPEHGNNHSLGEQVVSSGDQSSHTQDYDFDGPAGDDTYHNSDAGDEVIRLSLKNRTDPDHTPEYPDAVEAGVDIELDDYLPDFLQDDELQSLPEQHDYVDQDVDPDVDSDVDSDVDPDDEMPVNEDLLPHAEVSDELDFTRKTGPYEIPVEGVLQKQSREAYWIIDQETSNQAEILRHTLEQFGIEAEVTGIRKGPVITMFEILPAPGVKLARIVNLADNIALALAAASVRIVAPIPGKHAVGIEVPNNKRHLVTFSEILKEDEFSSGDHGIPVALGKDITGEAQIVDLTRTPHLLIAGATGAGKSVCVNSIITSVLYSRDPDEVKMILIDPKIVELKFYNDIPHLLTPVITDPKKAFQALQWCLFEMERRYSLLDAMAVRDVRSYNRKIREKKIATVKLPYIVVVVDEFADLMATSGKELESTLARLAAMSRAVGIHLVLATQRPSTDVITGLIKANIPSRIAFMVASKVDSRIIIDAVGAEKLLGKGDMLFTSSWDPFPSRIQGAFLSEAEVEEVVRHVKEQGSPDYIDDEIFIEDDDTGIVTGELDDPLMQKAIDIVCTANKASASYLQRRLSIGYNRAARLIEEMEEMGIVGPSNGSKPREILRNRDIM